MLCRKAVGVFGISKKRLARLLHDLGTMLESGLTIRRTLQVLSRNPKSPSLARALRHVAADIEQGFSFTQAIERRGHYFPQLVKELMHVAEASGSIGQVCLQLGKYYEMQVQIRRKMTGRMALPILQLLAAIAIIYGLNFIFKAVAGGALGIAAAALHVLEGIVVVALLYFVFNRWLVRIRLIDEILLRVPLIGHTMRTLALARFSWALYLMMEAGAGTTEALTRATRATNNGAFIGRTPTLLAAIADGAGLRGSLEQTGLFPIDYLEIISVAEESGMLSESLDRQATARFEEAERALAALTTAIVCVVRIGVMILLVMMIFAVAAQAFGPVRKLTGR